MRGKTSTTCLLFSSLAFASAACHDDAADEPLQRQLPSVGHAREPHRDGNRESRLPDGGQDARLPRGFTYDRGGIIRGPVDAKRLALVFTGGEHGEGALSILDALSERGVKASFFVTGDFLRQERCQPVLHRVVAEGHYLGPHSDSHPLYCPWEDRGRTLISRDEFRTDLERNLSDLTRYGRTRAEMRFFIPPYEWYNEDIVAWSAEMDLVLFNFTPGTRSNADYAPDDHRSFLPSAKIYQSILDFEATKPNGLNGFLLLLHLGSGPGRTDKMHPYIGPLIDELRRRGYEFTRVDQLLTSGG